MEKKFYICGLRPVIVEIHKDYRDYFALNMETGIFEENLRYSHQINFDPDGDVEEKKNLNLIPMLKILKRKKD